MIGLYSIWIRKRDQAPREVYALCWSSRRESVMTCRPAPDCEYPWACHRYHSDEREDVLLSTFLRTHQEAARDEQDALRPPYQLDISDGAQAKLRKLRGHEPEVEEARKRLHAIAYPSSFR